VCKSRFGQEIPALFLYKIGGIMPIVTVENAGKLSSDQKKQLIRKLTDVIVEVTKKPKQAVYVRIDEVPRENFGVGGKPLG